MPRIEDSSPDDSPVQTPRPQLEHQLEYWTRQLEGSKPAELFHDKIRSAVSSGQVGVQPVVFAPSTQHALHRFCKAHQMSPFSVLLAAFRATHYRLTGAEDATLGAFNTLPSTEDGENWSYRTIQCLRLKTQGESFMSLVKHVSSTLVDAKANGDRPVDGGAVYLSSQLDTFSQPRFFNTIFGLHGRTESDNGIGKTMKANVLSLGYDLEIHLHEGECYAGHVVFSEDIYHPKTISSMISILYKIVEHGIDQSETSISLLSLGSDSSEFCTSLPQAVRTSYPRHASIADVFRKQVIACPDAVAVKDSLSQLTYAQLDRLSDKLASWLCRRGLPVETLVGVYARRSCDAIVAFFGIIKANMAYVPLDVDAPAARIESILLSGSGSGLVLLGPELDALTIQDGPEWVHLDDALQSAPGGSNGHNTAMETTPSAESLAYVIFTSGSTGVPKGVLVEHRCIVRLVKDTDWMSTQDAATNVAHMSNLAFDAATVEIFTALLNGGTVICLDKATVLDNQALCRAFTQERIGAACFTPALLRYCLSESPDTISGLHFLMVGGDKLDVRDARQGLSLVKGKFYNGYGPTENTVFSTMHRVRAEDDYVNGVPIGHAISNSGAYVVDAQLRLVPVGVMGELIVTGDGLARGYIDPQQTRDRFVQVLIDGHWVRSYRTGDYVRCRPTDNEMEFFGRIDFQIKIRGNRVELPEIEHVLLGHESVGEAVALAHKRSGTDVTIVGFVTILDAEDAVVDDEEQENDVENEQIEVWKDLFDTEKYVGIDKIDGGQIGRDFTKWTSMYDGEMIDNNEMNEWLDDTMRTILDGKPAGDVLEIGSGTGMILFNLTKGLKTYFGLDPASSAISFIREAAARNPDLARKVQVQVGTALDVRRIRGLNSPELVIVNSVAQYFPTPDYFLRAIEDFIQLSSTRRLFFGDIRSYAMYKQFQASKVLHILGDSLTENEMRRRILAAERVEEELLLDPGFFTSLCERFPQHIDHVEILPKRMVATNELSCYRYAAVVHLTPGPDEPALEIYDVPDNAWVDFTSQYLNWEKTETLLRSADSSIVAISNIPFSKTILERLVVTSLDTTNNDRGHEKDWLSSIRDISKTYQSLAPTDLEELAAKTGFHVEISWARQYSLHGGLDAIFHKMPRTDGSRVLFRFPTDHAGRPFRTLSTHPLRRRRIQAVEKQLRDRALSKLPSYMVPSVIHVLDKMPINANGKWDRRALEDIATDLRVKPLSLDPGARLPKSPEEKRVQEAWANVLDLDPRSITARDSFLELGGDSIQAMRLVGTLRRQGFTLTVAQILSAPRLSDLADKMQKVTDTGADEVQAFALLSPGTDLDEACKQAASVCGVAVETVQDILPCTPLQEGLVAMTDQRQGAYVVRHIFELHPTVSEERFRRAWEQVIEAVPILRTRLADIPGLGIMQVVLSGKGNWRDGDNIEEYLMLDKREPMGIPQSLRHEAIIHGDKRLFVLTIHHALHDGWAMQLVLDALNQAYQGEVPNSPEPFERFIKYVRDLDREEMVNFWRKELKGVEVMRFPRLPSPTYQPAASRVITKALKGIQWVNKQTTAATAIRTAWAILLAAYNNSGDVVYGATVTGRQAPVPGIEGMIGPTFATVPIRILLDGDTKLDELLRQVQQHAIDVAPFEQIGLQNIRHISEDMSLACDFQTLLVVQPESIIELGSSEVFVRQLPSDSQRSGSQMNSLNTYALMVEVALGSEGMRISMSHDTTIIEEVQSQLILDQFAHILQQLVTMEDTAERKISDLNHVGDADLQRIWSWNRTPPIVKASIVHDLLHEIIIERPDTPAVCAWDGRLTYRELDQLSTSLAQHLVQLGVGPEVIVPLCFEKSMWTPVAILGVLKAGGASILLDVVNEPEGTLAAIVERVKPSLILSSRAKYALARRLARDKTVCVCDSSSSQEWHVQETSLPLVRPDNALYVAFTTESSQVQEGIVITHSNFAGAFNHQREKLAMTPDSRVLDARADALDIVLYTFCTGACLCIPSNWDRSNALPSVILGLAVNYARLAPTETRFLSKAVLDSLLVLQLTGEPARPSVMSQLSSSTKLLIVYTSPGSCGVVMVTTTSVESSDISMDTGTNTWIVDTRGTPHLALPGCIGELWLESPFLGRSYDQTAVSFHENPPWLLQGGPGPEQLGRHGRLYRTGDLARHLPDGRLQLLSHHGSQYGASVRGRWVDLGQVEDCAWEQLVSEGVNQQQNLHVIAEVATLKGETEPMLVLYVVLPSAATLTEEERWATLGRMVAGLESSMGKILTPQTEPAAYVPLKSLPITARGTTDRHALRELASSLPTSRLKRFFHSHVPRRMPETTQEKQLQELWAAVLKIDADKIGADDSFLQIGGDSVLAMRLVARARRNGLSLKTGDVLRWPRLSDLAKKMTSVTKKRATRYIAPLSLLASTVDRNWARSQAASLCNIEEHRVQDIFPCTPLQEGLIAMTEQHTDEYVAKVGFPLSSSTDPEKFSRAWADTVAALQILRTRIVDLPGQGLVQVIVDEKGSCPRVYEESVTDERLGLGTRLCHARLIGRAGNLQFRLVIHHSLYDGWSLPLMLNYINQVYNSFPPEKLLSLQGFVKYVQGVSLDDTAHYWREQFAGSEAVQFPTLPSPNYQYRADSTIERTIDDLIWPSNDITPASTVRAAWALLQARYTDSREAVFGGVVTGRQAPVDGIERMAGPTMATVPVRVVIDAEATIEQLLRQVHLQAVQMIPFEQTGLQRIRHLSAEADQCTRFQVLLGVQPVTSASDMSSDAVLTEYSGEGQADGTDEFGGFNSYALMVVCELGHNSLKIRMSHDSAVIDLIQAQRMLAQLEHLLRQLVAPEMWAIQVQEISAVSPADLDEVWAWNAEPPPAVEACVLDAIATTAHNRPNEMAICAWDGELTFEQLDGLSTRLAQHIIGLNTGIGPGTVLVLHFEKSMWMSVAMLAAIKTGAASVAFDATLPKERLLTIIEQVEPKLILSSATTANELVNLRSGLQVLPISQQHLDGFPQTTEHKQVHISADDPMCLVFTSGSTGKPKGIVLTHRNFSSAMQAHAEAYGVGTTCFRLYDFTSYSFDFAWSALLLALSYGVTLCVPSEAERKADVIESISRFRADFVFFTPSLVTALDFSKQSSLRTLAVGGELFNLAGMPALDKQICLVSIYGPSECTVVTTGNNLSNPNAYLGSLGRGYNTHTWVSDASDPSKLAPIGCTGELWLEGPLVGQGYFREPEKTAAVFVKDPRWLLEGNSKRKGRSGTLYRTGDLVKYMTDGSLEFIGRLDDQVKIRGQRVEFGEIEYNLRQILGTGENKAQLVVDYVTLKGMSKPTLTVFVVPHAPVGLVEDEMWAFVDRMVTDGVSERLAETLPSYMIPTAYIALPSFPMMVTGKADRRRLRQLAATTSRVAGQKTVHEMDIAQPDSQLEHILQTVWAQVLNVAEDSLSMEKEFNRLGGDSITAMQVVSRCRAQNIHVTVADILRSQTIRRLSNVCKTANLAPVYDNGDDGAMDEEAAWELSPIQKMFFAAHPSGNNHFNQSFILKTRTPIPLGKLQMAFKFLIQRHPMLRARFQVGENGQWTQEISSPGPDTILNEHHVIKRSDIVPIAQKAQRGLDIRAGKVFTADIFEVDRPAEQVVLLSSHHLVVDLVSWRIIWFDLETLLTGAQLGKPSMSFHRWCKIQQADAEISKNLSVPDIEPQYPYWGITPEENVEGSIMTISQRLEPTTTSLVLGDSNAVFGTEPLDILLAVFASAFDLVFQDRATPTFFLEGHGRESPEGMNTDLSETVGWFTTFHPVPLASAAGDDVCDLVRRAKDERARIPGKGRSYFASRCNNSARPDPYPVGEDIEVLVNYTGRFQQLESQDSLFTRLGEAEGDIILEEVSPDTRRFGLLGLTIEIIHDQLVISLGFNKLIRHQDRLARWLDTACHGLRATALALARMNPRPTLADYPLLDISHRDLDNLFDVQLKEMQLEKSHVRDIYPCTALQEGILLSKQAGIATYMNHWIWSCWVGVERGRTPVDPKQLGDAWNLALSRHGVFSTIFVNHPTTGRPLQVLLGRERHHVEYIHCIEDSPEIVLGSFQTPEFPTKSPPFSVKICSSLNGQVACRFDVSHTLIDAAAMAALLRDVAMIFEGKDLQPAPQFRTVVAHIVKMPELERIQYWTGFLKSVEPCCVTPDRDSAQRPETDGYGVLGVKMTSPSVLQEFCMSRGITRATFLQVAWAMVLSRLTGMDKPCFGYLASGRDIPLDGVDDMVAPLINMLVGTVDLTAGLDDVLIETSKRSVDHMAYQHVSLADIQHELGLGAHRLFNTALTVRDMYAQEQHEWALQLTAVVEGDPTEFDVLLSAGLDGPATIIELIYRHSTLSKSAATEMLGLLESAVDFLLSAREQQVISADAVSLRSSFFRNQAAVDEDTATAYWKSALAGLDATAFPTFPSPLHTPHVDSVTSTRILDVFTPPSHISASAALRAAWGLLLSRYSGASDVVFDVTTSPHGPRSRVAAVPAHVAIDGDMTRAYLLRATHKAAITSSLYERIGLQRIRQLGEDAARCCRGRSLLLVRTMSDNIDIDSETYSHLRSYGIIIECELGKPVGVHVRIHYSSALVNSKLAQRILDQFLYVLPLLTAAEACNDLVELVSIASPADVSDIWEWNGQSPKYEDMCIHESFSQSARHSPLAPAIDAWDGQLTRGQLDIASTRLANHLVNNLQVGPGHIIPLVFEKSMWTPVAMLAVMKTGAASVALDITQPEERLSLIIRQTNPSVILTSTAGCSTSRRLCGDATVVAVSWATFQEISATVDRTYELRENPESPLCIVYTSGSTGIPKGAILTHRSWSSALPRIAAACRIKQDESRIFDFAAYSFDIAWANFLLASHTGSCLCIPSESDRQNDLVAALQQSRATFVFLTPSLAVTLDLLPLADTLQTLALGGEPVRKQGILPILDLGIHVINWYGPAECTAMATFADLSKESVEGVIGHGVATNTWVVKRYSDGHDRLCGVGETGELFLEGPLVAAGYLDDTERTALSFIQNPAWLLKGGSRPGQQGRSGRVYRTGDMVKLCADGSLVYVGREDAQVKIRGQRVELGEVEHHVRQILSGYQVGADMVTLAGRQTAMLVAFAAPLKADAATAEQIRSELSSSMATINHKLCKVLPPHMCPAAYISIEAMPMTGTNKLDRRRLRQLGTSYTVENIIYPGEVQVTRRPPQTLNEKQLQKIWASLLGIDVNSIFADDSFFHLGGDSISAMRLVVAARGDGLTLRVSDVLQCPKLCDLAERLTTSDKSVKWTAPEQFSLLRVPSPHEFVQQHIIPAVCIDSPVVLDVFPTSWSQRDFITGVSDAGPLYSPYIMAELPSELEFAHLSKSCSELLRAIDILRTVFVQKDGQLLQVVLADLDVPLEHISIHNFEDALQRLRDQERGREHFLGRSPLRFVLLEDQSERRWFAMRISHAQYDGISLPSIMSVLGDLLRGSLPQRLPAFSNYMKHIATRNTVSYPFWRSLLQGSDMTPIRQNTAAVPATRRDTLILIEDTLEVPTGRASSDYTPASYFTACCAKLLSRISKCCDVVFGRVVSGRSALDKEIEDTGGPCTNTIPVRVEDAQSQVLDALARQIQQQLQDSVSHETVGFDEILEHCVTWPEDSREFGMITKYQNIDNEPGLEICGHRTLYSYHLAEMPVPQNDTIRITGVPSGRHITVSVEAASTKFDDDFLRHVLRELHCIILEDD
ncbi:acetyl-CoA synthetase-like protein [Xylariaceae sp. AK1471]|nr:acetyl-CoA synthetase-like protein [Xylariaceae sp. AK1471]